MNFNVIKVFYILFLLYTTIELLAISFYTISTNSVTKSTNRPAKTGLFSI